MSEKYRAQTEASSSKRMQIEASENEEREASLSENEEREAHLSENLQKEASLSENTNVEPITSNVGRITGESVAKSFRLVVLKYGFCKKYFDRNEPLTS